jgi:cytochrome c biogenesis protein CcmG/thiol:disulfide interchange protein DsbE
MSDGPPDTTMAPTGSSRRRTWLIAGGGTLVLVLLFLVFNGRFGKDPRLPDEAPLLGSPLPTMELELLDGSGTINFDDLRGDVLVVNFFASWCVPCRSEHGHLVNASAAYSDRGVQFLGVVYQDSTSAANRFLDELGRGPGTIYTQDEGSRVLIEFGVIGVPETYFVNADGVIVDKVYGPVDTEILTTKIDAILGG